MEMMQILWLVLLVIFIIAEASTAALVSIWFCVGALAALLVSAIAPGMVALQVVVFLLVGGLMLLALRPLARRLIDTRKVPTNADANIGKICQVVQEIQPARVGRVKLDNLEWSARSDYVIPVGEWAQVHAIEGVKLVVVPLAQQTPAYMPPPTQPMQ